MNLRAVFYLEGHSWLAHCLETNLIGDDAMKKATQIQLDFILNHCGTEDVNLALG